MKSKRITMSIVVATLMLVSLFAVVSSAASVSGQTSGTNTQLVGGVLAGTGPGISNVWKSSEDNAVFAIDTTSALWYRSIYSDGVWTSLGGRCTASPAAISWDGNNRMDVVVIGTDNAVWHKYTNDGGATWSGWESLGGRVVSGTGPAVSAWSAGRLDIFVQGTDGALWHKAWTGTSWSNWQSLGGRLLSSPAAASSGSNSIDVFVSGTDRAVWCRHWDSNSWSAWKSFGGRLAPGTGPAVNYYSYRLFVQGTDNKLWRIDFSSTGPTMGWSASGNPPEQLSAISPACSNIVANDHTAVGVSTTTGNIWWSADSLGNWNSWDSVGSP